MTLLYSTFSRKKVKLMGMFGWKEYGRRTITNYRGKKDGPNWGNPAHMDSHLSNVGCHLNVCGGARITKVGPDGEVIGVILGNGIHYYCRILSVSEAIQENIYGFLCWHEQNAFVRGCEMPYDWRGCYGVDITDDLKEVVRGPQHIIFQTRYYRMKEMEKIFQAVQRDIGLPVSEELLKTETYGSDPDWPYDLFQLLDGHGYIIAHAKRWYVEVEICSSKKFDQAKVLFHFGKVAKIQYVSY